MDRTQHRITTFHFYPVAFVLVVLAYVPFVVAQGIAVGVSSKEVSSTSVNPLVQAKKEPQVVVEPLSEMLAGVNPVMPFEKNILASENGHCPVGTIAYVATEQAEVVIKKKMMATGYGAPPVRRLSRSQKRLLALRAAKLDALRSLAEQVTGVHIWGGATVNDLVLVSDRVNVRLDAFIQGARVLSTQYMKDGTYEVIMELSFDQTVIKQLDMNRCLPDE